MRILGNHKSTSASFLIFGSPDDLEVDYEPDADIDLQFRGEEQALEVLDISNAVSVDLSEYTDPGVYDVPVIVNTPAGIEMISDQTINLTLLEKTEEVPDDSGQEESE